MSMIKKKIAAALSALALFMLSLLPLPCTPFSVSDIRADAVTYNSATEAAYARQVAELVNQQRKKYGVGTLILSEELCQAAIARTKELTRSFSHTRPNGNPSYTILPSYGVTYYSVAENIAYGQRTPEEVMNAWMTSTQGHRESILDSDFKYMGIGVYYSGGRYYWSQFFARGIGMTVAKEILPSSAPVSPGTPKITAAPGDGSVKLTWTAVSGAGSYGVAGYVSGKWTLLAQTAGTSYTLNNLKAGTKYKVAVIAKINGAWNKDFSNAVTVTPKAVSKYPVVSYEVSGSQFRLKWTAVSGAERYGVAVCQNSRWTVMAQVSNSVTTYTSPKVSRGTYKLAVCAKLGGNWDTGNIGGRAFYVTIQ